MKPKFSGRITLNELCKLIKVDDYDKVLEDITCCSDIYGSSFDYHMSQGKTEQEAETLAQEDECKELGEYMDRYRDAVVSASGELFREHGLELHPIKKSCGFEFRILPLTSWFDALSCVRETVNGYGMFSFSSNAEMCSSVPCGVREAVLSHLHWIKHWAEIYGEVSPASKVERAMRR